MSFLTGLFQNEGTQKMIFSMLKKQMAENDIRYIVLERMPDGEVQPKVYAASDCPVIMGQAKMDQIMEIMDEQARTIAEQAAEIINLNGEPQTSTDDSNNTAIEQQPL